MKKFSEFFESRDAEDILDQILTIMDTMSEEDIDEFGTVLYSEFFDEDEEDFGGVFTVDDVDTMIHELGPEAYDIILDLLDELEDEFDEDELEEGVSRRMQPGSYNRKKRKYMSISRSQHRQTKAERRRKARQTKQTRKRYYRANKKKIAMYQKSRNDAIKKGKHKVKVRRPG
jgi:hypothetical protein